MPGGASGGASGPNANGARTTFRPPWVKDGPKPIPMPTAPWAVKRQKEAPEPQAQSEGPPARKTSSVKIVPIQPPASENGTSKDPHTFERPKLREVPKAETAKPQPKEVKVPVTLNRRPSELPMAVHIETKRTAEPVVPKVDLKPVSREPPRKQSQHDITEHRDNIEKMIPAERNAIIRQESLKKVCPAPPPMPPSMPPMPPPPPPPEMPSVKREPMSRDQLEKIESLRSRPRKRPDWGAMMKAIEGGKKLKHVQCNDRSQPLLPQTQAKGQFIYESETANLHNQLLKQIQTGPKLKHVKTNDRSKPILQGLRKFRRQMTIEEQIMKSQSIANMAEPEVEEEPDEMDDIDKIRDDLQSTKQMLALELRNKEAQIRENKRLLAKLANLEAELDKERAREPNENSGSPQTSDDDNDKIVTSLKEEVTEVKKTADVLEKKFHDTANQLDTTKTELDEAKRQNQILEKKLQQALQGSGPKRQSIADRRESVPVGKEPPAEEEISEEEIFSESESEEDEESAEEKQKRRAEREIRFIRNKLKSYKNKVEAARRERKNHRDQMKKNQQAMKQEKKRFHDLQKEVNKMAALMKDDEEEEEDEEKEESEEEETEESESESESESSEEEETSEDEDEAMPVEEQKESLNSRTKRHENCLNALKKGNYMLKANVDRLQDDLNKQKEMVLSLQEDLDSVLNELG